jgi:hypothetical protein
VVIVFGRGLILRRFDCKAPDENGVEEESETVVEGMLELFDGVIGAHGVTGRGDGEGGGMDIFLGT